MPNIQIKRGLASALSATNPIVASGEPIFETDTLKLKIGDGVTAYNSLGVVGSGSFLLLSGGTLTGSISSPSGNFSNGINITSGSGSIYTSGDSIYFLNNNSGNLFFIGDQGGGNNVLAKYQNTTAGPFMFFRKYRGSFSSPSVVASGDNLGAIQFETMNYDGTITTQCARIQAITEATPTSGLTNLASQLRFFTSTSSNTFNSPTQRMVITSNGLVGINKTAPTSTLDVTGSIAGTTGIFTSLQMGSGSVSTPSIGSNNDLSTGFYFPTSGSLAIASSGYDRFKIDTNGNTLFGGQNVDTLRYVDIGNTNNSSNAGSILRLVTTSVSATGNISADLIKYKNGQFSINNNETDVSAFTSFNVGSSERLRITSSGNVGVGTTSPTSKLHVVGNSNLAGTLTFNDFTESVVVIGNSSTSKTITLTNGTVQTCTLTGNCTFTMPTATAGKSFTLFLSSGSGSFTATFTSVKWSGGTAPVITTTASKVDILSFISDGTYWYGAFSQNY